MTNPDRNPPASRTTRAFLYVGVACCLVAAGCLAAEMRANALRDAAATRDRAALHRELDAAQEARDEIQALMEKIAQAQAADRAQSEASDRRIEQSLRRLSEGKGEGEDKEETSR
jgi:uncharacterized protein YlxW (UPF0749 family)